MLSFHPFSFTSTLLCSLVASSFAANHQIVVGGQGLVFTPEETTAEVGDTVTFIYQPRQHTVTQSSFANPCTLLRNATTGAEGFNSGPVPVEAGSTSAPAWTLEITAATPIWFFCATSTHCQSGMVGSINALKTGNRTFAAFKSLAMGTTSSNGSASVVSSGIGAGATGSLSSVSAGDATAAASSGATSASGSSPSASASGTGAASTLGMSLSALLLAASVAVFAF